MIKSKHGAYYVVIKYKDLQGWNKLPGCGEIGEEDFGGPRCRGTHRIQDGHADTRRLSFYLARYYYKATGTGWRDVRKLQSLLPQGVQVFREDRLK